MTDKTIETQDLIPDSENRETSLTISRPNPETPVGCNKSKTGKLLCLSGSMKNPSLITLGDVMGRGKFDSDELRYFTLQVICNNMSPQYHLGDIMVCREIKKSGWIEWGRVHVLDTVQGIVMAKIYKNPSGGILCVSGDREEYPDFVIPEDEIYAISIVVGSVRLGN